MTDNATPKPRRTPRPVRYPAAIPRTMTTTAQRAELEELTEGGKRTLGDVVRELIAIGLAFRGTEAAEGVRVEP